MKNFVRNLISAFLNVFSFAAPKNRVAVLMYHSVGRNNIPSTVSPENFAQQMAYLKEKRSQVISLANLADILEKKQPWPAQAVVLTFDDGYADNFTFAWPILQKYNFPATIFLTTGTVGGEKIKKTGERLPMLAWPEIAKMQKSGLIDFQPHTISHPRLSEISLGEAQKEISQSRAVIQERLGKEARFLAYPYGAYNQEVIDLLRQNDFRAALTVERGLVKRASSLFELPRLAMFLKTSLNQFKSKLNFGF